MMHLHQAHAIHKYRANHVHYNSNNLGYIYAHKKDAKLHDT